FVGDLFRHVSRPAFRRVECDNPDRVGILAMQQVRDHGLPVGALLVGLWPSATKLPTEIVQHAVNLALARISHDRGRVTHDTTPDPSPHQRLTKRAGTRNLLSVCAGRTGAPLIKGVRCYVTSGRAAY